MEILHNGIIQVGLCPEKGGRIFSLSFCGKPDRFYHSSTVDESSPWKNWGGDMLWVAPQSTWGWPPPPEWECEPWDYLPDGDGALMISGLFRGAQLQRHIDFEAKGTLRVVNTLRAIDQSCDWALWNITQVPLEGVEVSASCLGDIHVFDYPPQVTIPELRQAGQLSGEKLITLSPEYKQDYKIGWFDPVGRIEVLYSDGVKLIKEFELQPSTADYPHGGNVEFYRCKDYQEAEIGWSRVKLNPGESVSVTQRFSLERK